MKKTYRNDVLELVRFRNRFITLALTKPWVALTSPGGIAGCAFTSIGLVVLVDEPAAFALVRGLGHELEWRFPKPLGILGNPFPVLGACDLY